MNEKRIAALTCPDEIVKPLADYALENGIIGEGEEEFFTSDILDMLSPRPSEVIAQFDELHEKSPAAAFDMLYDLGVKNDYVKASAIAKKRVLENLDHADSHRNHREFKQAGKE